MVTSPRVEVSIDQDVYLPGSTVTGTIRIHSSSSIRGDRIHARFIGKSQAEFQSDCKRTYSNLRTIVDDSKELWKYHSLAQMLGLGEEIEPDEPSSFSPQAQFPFHFHIPDHAPTSLTVPGVPVNIRYAIEFRVFDSSTVSIFHEYPIIVVRPLCVTRPISNGRMNHSKKISLPGDRSILLECSLGKSVFTSADEIDARITVVNRWKESLKYIRFFLITKVEATARSLDANGDLTTKTFLLEHNGVGMPSDKVKIPCGEAFTFSPHYNVPGLNPDATIPDFLRLSHSLAIDVGRSKQLVLARLQIPVSIVTAFVEVAPTKSVSTPKEEVLIDLSSSSPSNHFLALSPTNPFRNAQFDLLA